MGIDANTGQTGLFALLAKLDEQGADDAEVTYQVREYLQAKARYEGIPWHGTFELTPLCNLSCVMCYVHLSKEQLVQSGRAILTAEQWKHIMEQAIDAGMMNATLTGGECLTHPAFDELYLYLLDHGIGVTIKSNGLLMTEERVQFFKEHPPEGVQITLYGADNDTYEKVTGVRGFDAAIAGIRRVKDAGIPLEVCVTPTKPAFANMEKLLTLIDSLDVPVGISSMLFEPREETGRQTKPLQLSLDEYVQLYKMRARLKHRTLIPQCGENVPKVGSGKHEPIVGIPCGGGQCSFAVHWNGRIHPCLSMDDISADVLNAPFLDGWRTIHEAVQKLEFPGECIGCTYQGICSPCVLSHQSNGDSSHPNTKFCERSKRMFEEGLVVCAK